LTKSLPIIIFGGDEKKRKKDDKQKRIGRVLHSFSSEKVRFQKKSFNPFLQL
jgi:hypothetical protein